MKKIHPAASILCYLLGALLFLFYLTTLWNGLHPTPSIEYRMFYLEQQLAHWPGENGLSVESGVPLTFGSEFGSGQGAGHLARDEWVLREDAGWQTPAVRCAAP